MGGRSSGIPLRCAAPLVAGRELVVEDRDRGWRGDRRRRQQTSQRSPLVRREGRQLSEELEEVGRTPRRGLNDRVVARLCKLCANRISDRCVRLVFLGVCAGVEQPSKLPVVGSIPTGRTCLRQSQEVAKRLKKPEIQGDGAARSGRQNRPTTKGGSSLDSHIEGPTSIRPFVRPSSCAIMIVDICQNLLP